MIKIKDVTKGIDVRGHESTALLNGLANFVPFNCRTLFPEYPWKPWHYGF